ncbi:MAG TPA: ABC transporter substrate-binding protein [Xanthobacteraceae bacterium]|jgi:ABC-type nitrate/sulfonate/bicarbonate transport system substrate-binding protein
MMRPLRFSKVLALALTLAASAAPVRAADTVTIGTVGSASANIWPVFIALNKGFFAEQDLKIDLVYVQSSAQMIQQLTAGSLDVTISTGLVDPIRAIDKGSPIAIVRLESQSPPYALVAKPGITSFAQLKGKTISLGGPKDITRIYVERMLAPSGVKPGEFDMVYAGATSARAQALLAGAVDAAILLPPFNFQAVAQGYVELGLTVDFAPELPFSGTVVNLAWAKTHAAVLARVLAAHAKSVAWFEDDNNRAEAVKMMVAASGLKPDEVEKAYAFYRKGKFFEPTGKVSRKKLGALVDALAGLGDIPHLDIDRLILPGVTQMTD